MNLRFVAICLIIFASGCATGSGGTWSPGASDKVRFAGDYVAVVVQPGDSLSSLAATYLHDSTRDWVISEFNHVSEIASGDELVIPLKPFKRGGLSPDRCQTVAVLSYHHFADKSTDRTIVSQESFEAQMRLLKEKGYRVITLDQLFDFMDFTGEVPEKSVVITIDDGWRSTYDIAFPILKKYGFPATLFIYTQLITGGAKTLSWGQVREMAEQGLDIQSHTISHRNLGQQNPAESMEAYYLDLERELLEPTRIIEQKIGRKSRYLAYPYGETNNLVIALLKKLGYRGAFTVVREGNPFFLSDYRLNRAMVFGDFDLARFEKNLGTGNQRVLR
jgi:peptidoglycan/xylan/chitin deacetylase (PgdA/CDA1 family)